MNTASNLPANQQEPGGVQAVKIAISRRADEFKAVLPSHISIDKFQRTVATAVLSTPKLLDCDRQSFMIACLKLAQDGLLPDGREAALVPFKTRVKTGSGRNDWSDKWIVQPMPMVYGLRKKVLQSGEVVSLQVGVVYLAEVQDGHFLYEIGMEPPIRHRPKLDMTDEQMADQNLVAAYSIARIKPEGDNEPYWSVEVMRRAEVQKVREMSQTGATRDRNGNARTPTGPWVDWEPEMWKKTALRRHSKVLPMSGDILDTFLREEDEERAAESAAAMLAAGPRTPAVLPQHDAVTGELLADQSGTASGVAIDPGQDGELARDPQTGMTDVPEEVARQLDAGDPGAEPDYDDDTPLDLYRGQPWAEKRREVIDGLHEAANMVDLNSIVSRYAKDVQAMPDEVRAEIERIAATVKAKLAPKKG